MRRRDPILHFHVPNPTSPRSPEQESYIPWTLWDNRFWIRASIIPGQDPLMSQCTSDPKSQYGDEEKTSTSTPVPTRTLSENNEERSKESRIQLVIRPLRQSDLSAVRRLHTKKSKTKGRNTNSVYEGDGEREDSSGVAAFFARLDREAPGQSRFTVPVLAISKDGADGAVRPVDVPLALPTIDLMFPRLESTDWTLTWEWKYKMIDLESLKLIGSV
jgi:WD repeat-containing protein 48